MTAIFILMQPTKVTMLGLGIMGGGAAHNLLKNKFDLTVWNRTAAKAQPLLAEGAKWANTPREAVADADVVISFVADDAAAAATWDGPNGALAGMKPNAIAVECGTMSLDRTRAMAKAAAERGVRFMDAPVTGSKVAAANGQLALLVGADEATLAEAKPVLQSISSTILHIGPVGSGALYKLINNMVAASHLVVLAEGLRMAEKGGLNMKMIGEAIPTGPFASRIVMMKLQNALTHDHSDVHFELQWMLKDINYALQAAEELGISLPMMGLTQKHFAQAAAAGMAELDTSAVVESGAVQS